MSSNSDQKLSFRRHALAARRQLSDQRRQQASLDVCESLIRKPQFRAARSIAIYLPMRDEVDVRPLLERATRMKKRVFAPRINKKGSMEFFFVSARSTFTENRFGILEPPRGEKIDARLLDVVIVPLVGFDSSGNRLGMGGGFYDRTFAFLRHRQNFRKPRFIGVGFSCQEIDQIPASPWDIQLFQVVTESGTTTFPV